MFIKIPIIQSKKMEEPVGMTGKPKRTETDLSSQRDYWESRNYSRRCYIKLAKSFNNLELKDICLHIINLGQFLGVFFIR